MRLPKVSTSLVGNPGLIHTVPARNPIHKDRGYCSELPSIEQQLYPFSKV